MAVLVTGGAGYIGSHMVLALLEKGETVVVLDRLSTGHRLAVAPGAELVVADAADRELVARVIREHEVDAVVHFAGSVVVPESVACPLDYYQNNTCVSRGLIEVAVKSGVKSFVFSSTAAVYGTVGAGRVSEATPRLPQSPYGWSKLMTEQMLEDASAAHDLRHACLRYFNVAGADPHGRAGQSTTGATHLIKVACEVATGQRECLSIFGTDYPTHDGTCIRDYIHVSDLVAAHGLALDALRGGGESFVANLGYGRGVSVREVVAAVERVSKEPLKVREAGRRPGDAMEVVADPSFARAHLGWRPVHDCLDRIIAHALSWEAKGLGAR